MIGNSEMFDEIFKNFKKVSFSFPFVVFSHFDAVFGCLQIFHSDSGNSVSPQKRVFFAFCVLLIFHFEPIFFQTNLFLKTLTFPITKVIRTAINV